MLQFNTFTSYDKKSSTLVEGKIFKKCNFCDKKICDNHSRCCSFYNNIDLSKDEVHICPYGCTVIVKEGNIITSLLIRERINNKTKKNFSKDLREKTVYSEEEIMNFMNYSFSRDYELERYKEAIHDIRNAATYFSLMIEEFKNNKGQEKLTDDEVALISLYELINFRLDVLDEDVISTKLEEKIQKIHPMIMKLTYMLSYKAKSRNIKIKVSPNQENYFSVNNHLYLALFILIENSVKYALSNTTINIDFEETEDKTVIFIKNISNPIKIINPNDLLKKGIRGDNSKALGSGIGLSFANELLEKTHAELDIDIKKSNSGNDVFIIIITLSKQILLN